MSLVLEALRRLEKPDSAPGSVGVAVASYKPRQDERRSALPLILGLVAGLALLEFVIPRVLPTNPSKPAAATSAPSPAVSRRQPSANSVHSVERAEQELHRARQTADAAGPQLVAKDSAAGEASIGREADPKPRPISSQSSAPLSAEKLSNTLVLQAISERDSHPIAIVSDQLVKEGDLIAGARVTKIGSDSVEILLPTGTKNTIRFPPAPPQPSPTANDRR